MGLGNFLIPPEDIHIISRWVKLDYDYNANSGRQWKLARHGDNSISVEVVTKDFLTALQVAQKLET